MFYVFKYSTVTTRLSQLYFNVKLGTYPAKFGSESGIRQSAY